MTIAIIPARGGSKRIPRKNIRLFSGKPVLAWPIEAARASGCFTRILVSTDDPEIAQVARDWGAEVPFLRPAALADDHQGTTPVIQHALNWLKEAGQLPPLACCIYATSPLLEAEDLRQAMAWLEEDADLQYIFSAARFSFPIQRALRKRTAGGVEPVQPEHISRRSQDLEPAFHDAGQFYFGRSEAFLTGMATFAPHSRMLELPGYRVQDIDTEEDWQRAELLHEVLRRRR